MPSHPLRQTGGRRLTSRCDNHPEYPLVTVYTIVRNRKETLPRTIMSVSHQSYRNIEYIIIDGASNDGTLEVIKQFDDKIDMWISEPDMGTVDANNKALSMVHGDITFWLASDDWIDPDFIEMAVNTILRSGADFVFGDMMMYKDGKRIALCEGDEDYAKSLMSGYPHFNFPTIVVKRKCFQEIGLLDVARRFTADYEWILRLYLSGGKGFYNSSLVVHRGVGGIGESFSAQSLLDLLSLLSQYGLPKSKAVNAYLYYLMRRGSVQAIKFFLPDIIYKKLKHAVHGE